MKITTKKCSYEQAMGKKRPKHVKPWKPIFLLQLVIRILSIFDLAPCKFTFRKHGMDKLGKKEPCLILMNHSSFIDLKIASRIFFPRRYGIVCTTDGFVGFFMSLLMRLLGCIPTQKFVTDMTLIQDMQYMLREKNTSVLMFPEAGYSFDGRATTLPRKLGILLKKLNVPVVTVITQGAFARDPLYNGLKKRKVPVSADVTYLLSPEDLKTKSVGELDAMIDQVFSFDNFKWQQENNISITEPFRAEGLNRILYRCPHCGEEGKTQGIDSRLICHCCSKEYILDEHGYLQAKDGNPAFRHIPNWYAWQRQQVRQEIEEGRYRLDVEVDIGVLVDYKALYMVGSGRLIHDDSGFRLTGCDGKLSYAQSPLASHTLNADYYWYEIGDVICIGNRDVLYYCFPKNCGDVVSKARLAQEEIYKLKKSRARRANA